MRTTAEIAKWREENPSVILDLRSANLRSANLRSANLRGANLGSANLGSADLGSANLGSADLVNADLGGANLRDADLRDADLRDADLRDAYLRGANLHGANLGGEHGIYLLNVHDPRGYLAYAQVKNGVTMIGSGCRYFTLEEAKEHWGENYEGDREIGDRYLAGLAQLDCNVFLAWVKKQL
jgi:uncharacterized protein YjbI with pentapeptide repeats